MVSSKVRPDPQKSLVGFTVGDVHYAVPIAAVREIVNPLELTVLPHSPPAVAGVANHRGTVIPVVDLRARFGLGRAEDQRRAKWILVEVEAHTVGLMVDGVTEVFGTGGAELGAAPSLGAGDDVRGIIGVARHAEQLVFVLDVDRFDALVSPLAATVLRDRGMRIVSGGTDSHLFLVDLRAKKITGKDAEAALAGAHITVNKNTIPGIQQSKCAGRPDQSIRLLQRYGKVEAFGGKRH